jgi:putative spermidine/putrescine transport system ATP-binding protein
VSSVELRELAKGFGGVAAVRGVSALVPQGELLALLGPSGCGKTTTLRMLAGIIRPDAGRVVFGERDVTRLPPESRDVGLVFQHYALFPHRSVADNVAFGLRMRKHRKAERREPVRQMLERLRLDGLGGRLPAELSGGQRQRVALGRALVTRPSVLLLDEPLSNLDANLREEMRFYIRELVTEFGITTIYVTHDQAEALALADRIIVMRAGQIEQMGRPDEIYETPRSPFVARFMGFENTFAVEQGRLATTGGSLAPGFALPAAAKALGWRPQAVTLGAGPHRGRVRGVSYLGQTVEYLLETPAGPVKAEVPAAAPRHEAGAEIAFDLPLATAAVMERA